MIGVREPGLLVGFEGEFDFSGSMERPSQEVEILGIHVLENQPGVNRDRRLVMVLVSSRAGSKLQELRVAGNLFEVLTGKNLGPLPILTSVGGPRVRREIRGRPGFGPENSGTKSGTPANQDEQRDHLAPVAGFSFHESTHAFGPFRPSSNETSSWTTRYKGDSIPG